MYTFSHKNIDKFEKKELFTHEILDPMSPLGFAMKNNETVSRNSEETFIHLLIWLYNAGKKCI